MPKPSGLKRNSCVSKDVPVVEAENDEASQISIRNMSTSPLAMEPRISLSAPDCPEAAAALAGRSPASPSGQPSRKTPGGGGGVLLCATLIWPEPAFPEFEMTDQPLAKVELKPENDR